MIGSQIVAKRLIDAIDFAELYVAKHPAAACAGALMIGMFLGWWIKRR
jgi:ElaB/YqjD/DUF883 family membrane-anchored ribosome-binding protein